MPRRSVLLTLLCLLVYAAVGAHASPRERAPGGKDLKRAEAVLSKLGRLEATAAAGDREALRKVARKLYPGLFRDVSKLREGDLKTDLTTAVALYESALRAGGKGGDAPDCSRELRESYARLCLEHAGGGGARLLRAKALLHAGWAEAGLRHARGDRGASTLGAVGLIRAERATDRALAEEALRELKELAAGLFDGAPPADAGARSAYARGGGGHEALRGRLEQADRLLASLPRDRAARLLRDSRDAFRDGLYWRLKAEPARALVVNANSFEAHGALPRLGLRADDADRAAHANLRAGLKLIRSAEELLWPTGAGR
jgi:hypothetical protein